MLNEITDTYRNFTRNCISDLVRFLGLQFVKEFAIISASLYERSAHGIELSLAPSVCPHM